MCGQCRLLRRGIYQASLCFVASFALIKSYDKRALRAAAEFQWRRIFHFMLFVANEECTPVGYQRRNSSGLEPASQTIELQQRSVFGAAFAIKNTASLARAAEFYKRRTHCRSGAFVGRAGNPSHQLFRFERLQPTAPQIRETAQLTIAANELPLALCRAQMRIHARNNLRR